MASLSSNDERAAFIKEKSSGIYNGTNKIGEEIEILLKQKTGMIIKTKREEYGVWYCVYYSENGLREKETIEKIK